MQESGWKKPPWEYSISSTASLENKLDGHFFKESQTIPKCYSTTGTRLGGRCKSLQSCALSFSWTPACCGHSAVILNVWVWVWGGGKRPILSDQPPSLSAADLGLSSWLLQCLEALQYFIPFFFFFPCILSYQSFFFSLVTDSFTALNLRSHFWKFS